MDMNYETSDKDLSFDKGIGYFERCSRQETEQQWTQQMQENLCEFLSTINTAMFVNYLMSNQSECYTYCGIRNVNVTLANGRRVKVPSAAFLLQRVKLRGRARKKKAKSLFHPALELLGFIDKLSPEYLSIVVRAAVSCSSFESAQRELEFRGIKVSTEQIRKLTYKYADCFMSKRVENALDGSEKQAGLILEITVDGGRTRMREEVKKKNQVRKKASYVGNWREPVLFSIRVLNKKGELAQGVPQLMDATMENWKYGFALLKEYLSHYNLKEAKQITFIADGSKSIWSNIKPMFNDLKVDKYQEVVDFIHARQNLNEVISLINKHQPSQKKQKETKETLYEYLWQGKIDEIKNYIVDFFGKKRRDKKAALKKMNNYFGVQERFQYERIKKEGRPIGSGTVESAIRRVINMKLKNNGTFWLKNNCERVLYLRCQLLTKRWEILQGKLETRRCNLYNFKDLDATYQAA